MASKQFYLYRTKSPALALDLALDLAPALNWLGVQLKSRRSKLRSRSRLRSDQDQDEVFVPYSAILYDKRII